MFVKKILFLGLLLVFCLFFISCANKPNQPPTIQKVSGPSGFVNSSTQTFEWTGNDPDGEITGYEYLKNSGFWFETTSTEYTWTGVPEGPNEFKVKAKDNNGLYSEVITWTFDYVY